MAEWTDEKRKEIIKLYEAAKPTAENSGDIVETLAKEHGFTVNGVRMILIKANVYVKKETKAKATTSDKTKTVRINKTEAINKLAELIETEGLEVDMDILGKFTGKAAAYLAGVIEQLTTTE